MIRIEVDLVAPVLVVPVPGVDERPQLERVRIHVEAGRWEDAAADLRRMQDAGLLPASVLARRSVGVVGDDRDDVLGANERIAHAPEA